MATFIVEMKGGDYLLVAGAADAHAAIRVASRYTATHGIPLSARLSCPDSLDEPEISLYVCADR
jgi:uncharacterized protein YcsI (UPF0317 family)